ncbi:MAG TPA: hypothetical protein VI137_16795 [Pseudolabrys sp.]|jgi:hypothetical protein
MTRPLPNPFELPTEPLRENPFEISEELAADLERYLIVLRRSPNETLH